MRVLKAISASLLLLLALPLVVSAAATDPYVADPNWPTQQGRRDATNYGGYDITGVAVDRSGRVFVNQGGEHPILVFDRAGNYLYSFGEHILQEPHTCRVDADGNVWTTDVNTHQLFKFSPEGTLLATYGVQNRPAKTPGHFSGPNDLAFAPNGDIFVAEGDGDRVSRISRDGTYITSWGKRGKTPGLFYFPHSIAVDSSSRVYVADRGNKRIQVFSPDGQLLAVWPKMKQVYGLWVNGNELITCDGHKDTMSIYNLSGQLLAKWGRSGRKPGTFNEPHQLCVDHEGVLWVAEAGNRRVQRFTRQ